jgi:hypothetical protein
LNNKRKFLELGTKLKKSYQPAGILFINSQFGKIKKTSHLNSKEYAKGEL